VIPVFSWSNLYLAPLFILIGGVLGAIIKSRPALKKIDADREANLLSERAKEMQEMRERIERLEEAAEKKDRQHAAEIARYRHRINNLDQAFNALLMLLKQGVSVEEAVGAVEKMRAEQLEREAKESATLHAVALKGAMQ
jgi:uncharacterized iron-regulated protein